MTLYGYTSASRIYGWVGHSQKMGWFAIMQTCGNLVTTKVPPVPRPPAPKPVSAPTPKPVSTPTPTPTPPQIIENIIQSKTAINASQGLVDASTVTAQASDQIQYTITAQNAGNAQATVKLEAQNAGNAQATVRLEEHLADVLEYATMLDNGGGTFDATAKTLVWPDVQLAPGAKAIRTFAIRVLDTIPATAQGISDPSSYNCVMTNVFGNAVTINVNCTAPKVVEQVVSELPKTGPSENIIFAGVVLAISTYFYARTRQVKKEVRLIRRSLNTGTI